MGGGEGGIGGQAGFPLETWFWEMPLCTRWWTTATVLTSALVQCQIVTPFQLFYSFRAVFIKSQVSALSHLVLQRLTTLVLASPHNLPILWTFVARPCLSRLLLTTILEALGGILWPIPGPFFMAFTVCDDLPHMSLSSGIDAISWTPSIFDTRLHLVETKSRYSAELPWTLGIHRPISSMGLDGIQFGSTRHYS